VGAALPILMYHNVAEPPAGTPIPALYVPPESFAAQMRLLARLGIRGVTMSEGLRWLRDGRGGRAVVITLDDGYADNVENALPILARHGFTATCYVASGALGSYNLWDAEKLQVRKPVMTTEQLREWVEAGMEVGAHTRTHPHLPQVSPDRVGEEVRGSKTDLEALTGREVLHFCYPYGEFDDGVLEVVRGAGFQSATTVHRARARPQDDPYRLPRVQVRQQDPLGRFLLKVLTPYEDFRGRRAARRRQRLERRPD
jgi:peptidoglycan/xylan/chitin deacetylase (PgdA/CDA1 family)